MQVTLVIEISLEHRKACAEGRMGFIDNRRMMFSKEGEMLASRMGEGSRI